MVRDVRSHRSKKLQLIPFAKKDIKYIRLPNFSLNFQYVCVYIFLFLLFLTNSKLSDEPFVKLRDSGWEAVIENFQYYQFSSCIDFYILNFPVISQRPNDVGHYCLPLSKVISTISRVLYLYKLNVRTCSYNTSNSTCMCSRNKSLTMCYETLVFKDVST